MHDFPGTVDFKVPKRPRMKGPLVIFTLPDVSATMVLDLNNTEDSIDLPRIEFVAAQGEDIKYKPGQPIEFNVTFTIDGVGMDNIASDRAYFRILIRSDTQDHVVDRYDPTRDPNSQVVLSVKDLGGPMGDRQAKLTLISAKEDPEGLMTVMYKVHFNSSANLPLSWLSYQFAVTFYQEGHEGPFPKGYMGFVHDTSFDNSRVQCEAGSHDCVLLCEALGDEVTDIQITVMTDQGPDSSLSNTVTFTEGLASAEVHVRNVTSEDAGYFHCTAKSPTQQIIRVLEMEIVKIAKINEELSNATLFDNGTMLVTCVAEGTPAPNVTFPHRHDQNDVHVTHPSQSQTRADLFIHEIENHSSSFICQASNTERAGILGDDFFNIMYTPPVYSYH
ncbi:uncharacterized protein LOC143285867 [Babylonia areolata]|uniref:uncharacterized protein LOC143285867 n=1 Tax=Babylonia areolata TaxID=304850 RepID=UPI003FD5C9F8